MIEFLNIVNNSENIARDIAIEIYLSSDTPYILSTLNIKLNNENIYSNGEFSLLYINSQIQVLSQNQIRITLIRNTQYPSFSVNILNVSISNLNELESNSIIFTIEDYNNPIIDNFSTTTQENTTIYFTIKDQENNLSINNITIIVRYNDVVIPAFLNGFFHPQYSESYIEKTGNIYKFLLKPNFFYDFDTDINIDISCYDNNNNYTSETFTFRIKKFDFLKVLCIEPNTNDLVNRYANYIFKLVDESNIGIKEYSLLINNKKIDKDSKDYILKEYKESNSIIYLYLTKENGFEPDSLIDFNIKLINNRDHEITYERTFIIESRKYPEINIITPKNESIISPNDVEINIDIYYDADLNLNNIGIFIDGYQTYFNDYYLNSESNINNYDGYYVDVREYIKEPIIYQNELIYNGYKTIITKDINKYNFFIQPINQLKNNKLYDLVVNVKDVEGKTDSKQIRFYTDSTYYINTYSTVKTGLYNNYLDNIILVPNNSNYYTYYTIDGSDPLIDNNLNVIGTTKLYTSPISIYKEGLTILKYFSVDPVTKYREKTKTEKIFIMIKDEELKKTTRIINTITIPTKIITIDNIENYEVGDIINIIDDNNTSFIRTIDYINNINNPNYIIVNKDVYNLINNPRFYKINKDNNSYKIDSFSNIIIGNNSKIDRPSCCIIDNFRLLNIASNDEDIFIDYIILLKNKRFYSLKNKKRNELYNMSDREFYRITMDDNTLLYFDFNNIENLINKDYKIIVSENNDNTIIIKVKIKEQDMDKIYNIEQILRKYIPINYNIKIIANMEE